MDKVETATEVTYTIWTTNGDSLFILHKDEPLRWTVVPPAAEREDLTWQQVVANVELSITPITN